MTAKQIVKEIMKLRGFSQKTLADELNYPTVTGVANRLNGKTTKDMNVDTLVKFVSAMNCDVIIKSRLADKSEWKITSDDNKQEMK